jgi:pimeloyl-ACP methyl ester carboxylesterase
MARLMSLFALVLSAPAFGADAPVKVLPLPGQVFQVAGRTAFVIDPPTKPGEGRTPWVWYAPTLPGLPQAAETWMFQKFHDAGIAIAGIDVGESYGSPDGCKLFSSLHEELTKRGYSSKPVLLGRSRGGLMALSWAADNPDKVGGFAGIYPVCNLASYPGLEKAAPAYGTTPDKLQQDLKTINPVDRLEPLAKAKVPLFAIHGDVDTVVPLEANSKLVETRYKAAGGQMTLIVPAGQGHNMWRGFFESEELVKFVIQNAKP